MTKAEILRKVTDEVREATTNKRIAKHKKYADKIVNGKCHCFAQLGNSSVKVKVRKKYSPSLVIDAIVDYGFTVIESSQNGRTILTIKW